jgi:hypothetical protein
VQLRRAAGVLAVIAGLGGCKQAIGYESPTTLSAAMACSDGIKDFNETDVDCGGGTCPACANGKDCKVGSDCEDKVCVQGVCAAPTCHDGIKDGEETDVDCGGPMCPPCHAGDTCKIASDCLGDVCTAMVCILNCDANVKDGNETDVDCGGGTCPPCAIGKMCKVNADCDSGICTAGVCADFLSWAVQLGGASASVDLVGVGLDNAANAILAANFEGIASFGGSMSYGASNPETYGFAFARYDPNGNHLWDEGYVTDVLAAQSVSCLAVDTPGAEPDFAAVGGYGPMGIDFGGGVSLPDVSPPASEAFYVTFDPTGPDVAESIGDPAGITGAVCGGLAFGPGSGSVIIAGANGPGKYQVNTTTVNDYDLFIVDLATFGWGQTYNDGALGVDKFVGVRTDPTGDVVAAGVHRGMLDFGGGARNGATDPGFVLELDPMGVYAWDKSFGATPDAVAVDGMGDAVICGEFNGTVDFGAGMLTAAHTSIFVVKLDPMGNTVWSKAFPIAFPTGGTSPSATTTVTTDVAGNVLVGVTVTTGETVDFGGGPLAGGVLVVKLDPSGSIVWGKGFGAPYKAALSGIAAYDATNILLGGTFSESLDFGSTTLTTTAPGSVFLAKLSLP